MANKWFETVAVAQRRAKRRLPPSVYGALVAGAEAGVTVRDNVAAFSELGFAPHVAGLPTTREMATTVMGQEISLPVLISPTGVQAVHPDGEVAVARAAAARGTVMALSSFASKPVEEVLAANPRTFFQMYWVGGRDEMAARMERARAAGAVGLIATLDWSFSFGRDWGSPHIPEALTLREMIRHAPEAAMRPSWLAQWLRAGTLPDLTVPNLPVGGGPGAHVLRRVRAVAGHAAAVLGRRCVAARAVGRPVHAQGRHQGRRCEAGRGRRRDGHLGVQPRRQQPGRDACHDPAATGHRARGRRPGRGPDGRRGATRRRRGQGAGARRAGRADRARLLVGARRERAGRRGERARPAAVRDRRLPARAGALVDFRAIAREPGDTPGFHPPPRRVKPGLSDNLALLKSRQIELLWPELALLRSCVRATHRRHRASNIQPIEPLFRAIGRRCQLRPGRCQVRMVPSL